MELNENKQNKNEQLTVLWVKVQPNILRYILSMVPNFDDAEDILQRVALATVQKYYQYDPHKSFLSWTIGLARIEILRYRNENSRQKMISIEAMNTFSECIEKESIYMSNEIDTALALCLSKVKSKWKNIIEFRYLRGYKPKRIAQQLNMSENAVLIALYRIRKALKECVAYEIEKKRV